MARAIMVELRLHCGGSASSLELVNAPVVLGLSEHGLDHHLAFSVKAAALPKGVSYRLTYDQSQVHYDFNAEGWLLDEQDRYGNTISTPPEIGEANGQEKTTDTQGRKYINQWNKTTEPYQDWIEELTDKSGARWGHFGQAPTVARGALVRVGRPRRPVLLEQTADSELASCKLRVSSTLSPS